MKKEEALGYFVLFVFGLSIFLAWKYDGYFLYLNAISLLAVGQKKPARQEAAQADAALATRQAQLFCPHCQTRGHVTTKEVKLKKGISGAKATAALVTGGLSILGTGLSRKEKMTEASCSNCGSSWHF